MSNEPQGDEPKINLDEVDPETATPEQVAEVVKTAKSALAQKEHWRTQAIDPKSGKPWQDVVTELQKPSSTISAPATPTAPPDEELRKDISSLKLAEEKRQFGYSHNLSPEETDMAFALALGQQVKPADILEQEFFKTGLDGLRVKRKNASATPGSSSRAPIVDGKAVDLNDPKSVKENWQKITGVA